MRRSMEIDGCTTLSRRTPATEVRCLPEPAEWRSSVSADRPTIIGLPDTLRVIVLMGRDDAVRRVDNRLMPHRWRGNWFAGGQNPSRRRWDIGR